MARAKDNARKQAEEQARKRRNSAAHRSLRRRAQKGAGARSASSAPDAAPQSVDAPATEPLVDSGSGRESAAEQSPDRTPTGELEAPLWLAPDGSARDEAHAPAAENPPSGVSEAAPDPDIEHTPERASVFAAPASEDELSEPEPSEPGLGEPHPDEDQTATSVFEPLGDTAVMSPVDGPAAGMDVPPWHAPDSDHRDDRAGDGAPPRKRSRALWAVPLTLVLLAGGYVGAQALVADDVARGTEVLGVEIGGMSHSEATDAVSRAAGAPEIQDLELRVGENSYALTATDAGLAVNAQATVDQVTGFTLAPQRLWEHIAGGAAIDPVLDRDDEVLADAVEVAAVELDGPAQDAGVTVEDGGVSVVPGRAAVIVDQEASATRIAQAWPSAQVIDLIAESEPPAVTDEDAAAFAAELENQTFAAPVTLVGDEAEATIEPATIASVSTVATGETGLELTIDGEALASRIIEDNPDLTTSGENASVSFNDAQEVVVDEGSAGITIDGEALGDAVLAAANSVDRIGELPYTEADPEVSAADLGIADFQEIVASFDTPLTAEPVRTQNLRVAASDIQGVIVHPGETFDLTEVLSPINEERGYRPAAVIVNGILTQGMGGGLSQMATTVYNAGYFAGWEVLDHRPHSVWFTRYPAGRESTIYTGSINVEFRNNTPYSAVFNSYLSGGRVYVDIWSTKHFDVETSASPKQNVVEPSVKEVTSANCEPKSAGQPGFTITNTRTVLLDGEEVDKTSDTWTYKPDDAIRCVSNEED